MADTLESRPVQRRLTAILSADIADYSGLMEADEAGTLERLKVNRPSTVWQRMHDDHGLQASLPSFRRYALATLPEAYGRRVSITVRRDDPPPGDEAQVDYGRLGKWTDPKTGETMILNAFILVLSFS